MAYPLPKQHFDGGTKIGEMFFVDGKFDPQDRGQDAKISVQTAGATLNGFISASCGVANFLNIRYAHFPARFRQAVPIDLSNVQGVIDATQYGPRCPQPYDTIHHELTGHLYERMGTFDEQSEFDCLNLNVYAPPDAVSLRSRLPVFVWLHGGAFVFGDGGCEFDGNDLVRYSTSLGKPIIVVSVSSRLGYFGFLTSKELRDEAQRNGEVGYMNQGFHDQRLAFQWVQNNIYLFGGDGSRVTAGGESAGAFSVLAHLRSNIQFFQQAFLMSCPRGTWLLPESGAQAEFDRLVSSIGIPQTAPASDKIAALRNLSPEELGGLLNGGKALPSFDEKMWPDQDSAQLLEHGPFPSWIKVVVTGKVKDECALFLQKWIDSTPEELIKVLKETFPDKRYQEDLFSAYGISEASSHGELVEMFMKFTTDHLIGQTTGAIADKHKSPPICLYSFNQEDFHDGLIQGRAHHSMDIPFLFHMDTVAGLNAPPAYRATADAYAKSVIELTHGETPWEAYGDKGRAMIFDGDKTGLATDIGFSRWRGLIDTKERAEMFEAGAPILPNAAAYGMMLKEMPGKNQ